MRQVCIYLIYLIIALTYGSVYRGLNLDLVILNILRVYCDPGNLVLVINANESEEKHFSEKLHNENVHIITSDTNITERY